MISVASTNRLCREGRELCERDDICDERLLAAGNGKDVVVTLGVVDTGAAVTPTSAVVQASFTSPVKKINAQISFPRFYKYR